MQKFSVNFVNDLQLDTSVLYFAKRTTFRILRADSFRILRYFIEEKVDIMFFTNGFLGEREDLRDHLKNFMLQLQKISKKVCEKLS